MKYFYIFIFCFVYSLVLAGPNTIQQNPATTNVMAAGSSGQVMTLGANNSVSWANGGGTTINNIITNQVTGPIMALGGGITNGVTGPGAPVSAPLSGWFGSGFINTNATPVITGTYTPFSVYFVSTNNISAGTNLIFSLLTNGAFAGISNVFVGGSGTNYLVNTNLLPVTANNVSIGVGITQNGNILVTNITAFWSIGQQVPTSIASVALTTTTNITTTLTNIPNNVTLAFNHWNLASGQFGPWISGFATNGSVTAASATLTCASAPFNANMVGWWVMLNHAGSNDIAVVNTNYPFGSNTKTFTTNYDLVAQITNFVSASQVTLTVTSSITFATCQFLCVTDCTPTFQTAWNFAHTNNGNNELDSPQGYYGFYTNWQSVSAWTNSPTCMINSPHVSSTAPEKIVGVVGLSGPAEIEAGGTTSLPFSPQGTMFVVLQRGTNSNLYSFIDTRDLTGPSIGADVSLLVPAPFAAPGGANLPAQPFNDVNYQFNGITFMTQFDPNMAVLNKIGAYKSDIVNCSFIAGFSLNGQMASTGTNGWAVVGAGAYNDNKQEMEHCQIMNFYNDVGIGGNQFLTDDSFFNSWNGVVSFAAADAANITRLSLQGVKNHFVAWGNMNINADPVFPQDSVNNEWINWPNLVIATNGTPVTGKINYIESAMQTLTLLPVWGSLASTLTVYGSMGQQNGAPTIPFVQQGLNFSSSTTFSNNVQINNILYLPNPAFLRIGYGGNFGIDFWNGSGEIRMDDGAGVVAVQGLGYNNSYSGMTPVANDYTYVVNRNTGLYQWISDSNGVFQVASNINTGGAIIPASVSGMGTVVNTNWILGGKYSFSYPVLVSANAILVTAGVSGNCDLDLEVAGNTTNRIAISTIVTSIPSSYTNYIGAFIPANTTFDFTNRSNGAGDSAAVYGGQYIIQ